MGLLSTNLSIDLVLSVLVVGGREKVLASPPWLIDHIVIGLPADGLQANKLRDSSEWENFELDLVGNELQRCSNRLLHLYASAVSLDGR
jgi:hypothetical protein